MPLQLLAILTIIESVLVSSRSTRSLPVDNLCCGSNTEAGQHMLTHIFVYSNRVKTCRLRRGQMLDSVKGKLQASAMTCKLSGARGQAAPWMTSEQRSKSSMTASIYRQAVDPCHDRLRQ